MLVLPPELHSRGQLGQVILELRSYAGKMHDRVVRAQVARLVDDVLPGLSVLSSKIVRVSNVALDDIPAIEALTQELETLRSAAPAIHMVMAAPPDDPIRMKLAEWFRGNVHPQVLLTFAVRPDIGGGMILRVGSRQYDLTYRTQLLNNKTRLAEVLHSART